MTKADFPEAEGFLSVAADWEEAETLQVGCRRGRSASEHPVLWVGKV